MANPSGTQPSLAVSSAAAPPRQVVPHAGHKGDGFHPGAVYRFNIDTDGDALADVAFSFTFSPYGNRRQTATANVGSRVELARIVIQQPRPTADPYWLGQHSERMTTRLRTRHRQARLKAMAPRTDRNPEDEYADDEYADYDAEDREQPSVPTAIPDDEPEDDVLEQRQEIPYGDGR
jgi:hypothetical protein